MHTCFLTSSLSALNAIGEDEKERAHSWKKRCGFISFLESSLASTTNDKRLVRKKRVFLYIKMGNNERYNCAFISRKKDFFKDFDFLE